MSRFRFPRQVRLLTAGDFRRVFGHAPVRVSDRHLLILARPNDLGHPRLGLVIAKRHVRRATQRNRVKRLIRESFRLYQHELPAVDLVVLARTGLAEQDNPALHALLERSWQRLVRYHRRYCDKAES